MRSRQQMPEWVSYLMKELTRPPYFLDHLLNQAKENGKHEAPNKEHKTTPQPDSHSSPRDNSPKRSTWKTSWSDKNVYTSSSHSPQQGSHSSSSPEQRRSTEFVKAALKDTDTNEVGPKRSWQAVFRQAGYPIALPKAYGWAVQSAEPVSNILKVSTKQGAFALKETHVSADRVDFIRKLTLYLRKQGFTGSPKVTLTEKKAAHWQKDKRIFYATNWIDGNTVNFASLPQLGSLASALATFHEYSRGFEADRYNPAPEFGVTSMTRRRAEDLKNILTRAESKSNPDEFDEVLIRIAPTLRDDVEKSVRIAEDTMCQRFLTRDEENPGICHLDVIPGNFIYGSNRHIHIIDLDLSTYGPRVLDLSHLLRRSLQVTNWQAETAYTCFLNYDSVQPITAEEYLWIQCLLTFPYRAWRLAHTRYHVFKDRRQTEEIREYAAQDTRRQAFLEAFSRQILREVT